MSKAQEREGVTFVGGPLSGTTGHISSGVLETLPMNVGGVRGSYVRDSAGQYLMKWKPAAVQHGKG